MEHNIIDVMTESQETVSEQTTKPQPRTLELYYDDRLSFTNIESVGDENIIRYVGGKLIAVGVGETTINTNNEEIIVKVNAAPISLIMIIGHSMGTEQGGNAEQSVVCEAGQTYSLMDTNTKQNVALITNDPNYENMGLGYSSEFRPNGIDLLTENDVGFGGEASGLAYRYNQITGEKIWILNAAVGGSNLEKWRPGTLNYNQAVKIFKCAAEILSREIEIGHYVLKNIGIIYHSCANGDQTWCPDMYRAEIEHFWSSLKIDLSYDIDSDGTDETVEFMGLVPIWNVSEMGFVDFVANPYQYNTSRALNNMYAFSDEYSDIFLASNDGRKILTDDDVKAYYSNTQEYQIRAEELVFPTDMTTAFADGVHYSQVTYNAIGMSIVDNIVNFIAKRELESVKMYLSDGITEMQSETRMNVGDEIVAIPLAEPISVNNLKFEAQGSIEYRNSVITALSEGDGMLTVSHDGKIVLELEFIVE